MQGASLAAHVGESDGHSKRWKRAARYSAEMKEAATEAAGLGEPNHPMLEAEVAAGDERSE